MHTRMLWIAVCLPRLPLEVQSPAHATLAAAPDTPLAVGNASQVLLANAAACRAGVLRGMRRATAFALCPPLRWVTRDLTREQAALSAIALWALQFTPNISLQPPHDEGPAGLLLEVHGSLALFGGLAALLKSLRSGLGTQGYVPRIASAPVPQAAWVLARASDGGGVAQTHELRSVLAPLPVWLLGAGRPHWNALRGVGVTSFANLWVLPRAGVARRFSEALLDELDRALGLKPDPRSWITAPPVFDVKVELSARVDSAEALLFAARRLIVQVMGWLTAQQAATRTLRFELWHEGRAPSPLSIQLAEPSRDEARFVTLLREVLSRTPLTAPVYELSLRCDAVVLAATPSATLFPAPQSKQEDWFRLLERLQARLGRAAVMRLALRAEHRPEQAYARRPADEAAPRTELEREAPRLPRPLWLLSTPISVAVQHVSAVRDASKAATSVTLVAGPERIESGWWEGPWAARDYFIARDTQGALVWVYRPRSPDSEFAKDTGWRLHGRFG